MEIVMSKHDDRLEEKSPAKPVSIAKDGELSDEQLNEVSGGSITRTIDKASPLFFQKCSTGEKQS
jgi:type VI protein secretion system component Hcp